MFKSFNRDNEERNAKANSHYTFVVLEGVGVTFYGGKTPEVHIHLIDDRDLLRTFNQAQLVFPGELRYPKVALPAFRLNAGDHVRVYNSQTWQYSRRLRIDSIFETARISEQFPTSGFVEYYMDGTIANLTAIASIGESLYYSSILKALMLTAIEGEGYEVDYTTVMHRAGFATRGNFDRWLGDILSAGLVAEVDSNHLRICDSLIYMFMHAINRRNIMSGPVFQF